MLLILGQLFGVYTSVTKYEVELCYCSCAAALGAFMLLWFHVHKRNLLLCSEGFVFYLLWLLIDNSKILVFLLIYIDLKQQFSNFWVHPWWRILFHLVENRVQLATNLSYPTKVQEQFYYPPRHISSPITGIGSPFRETQTRLYS